MEIENKNENNKLLFFDNQSFIVRSMIMSLQLYGWNVTYVSDIDNLFHILKHRHYNILILDIMAPVPPMTNKNVEFTESEINEMGDGLKTGVVLAKKVLKLEGYNKVPILFLSGARNPILYDPELQEHECAYMRKPAFSRHVDQKLREMLKFKDSD